MRKEGSVTHSTVKSEWDAQARAEDNKITESEKDTGQARVPIHRQDTQEEEKVVRVQSQDGEDGSGESQCLAVADRCD